MLLSGETTAQPNELTEDHTYTAFAKDEVDPHRRNALRGLAAAEKHHADL
jgi:vacuolar iron transporter family protein